MPNCEEPVQGPHSLQACGRPVDDRGLCDRPSEHVED